MFCVVTVTDVQPEIRPEVTRKIRKSFEKPAFAKASGVAGRGLRGCRGLGGMWTSDEIEVLHERKFVSASSRNQQAGSLRSPER
jgi:hypothetical protein